MPVIHVREEESFENVVRLMKEKITPLSPSTAALLSPARAAALGSSAVRHSSPHASPSK